MLSSFSYKNNYFMADGIYILLKKIFFFWIKFEILIRSSNFPLKFSKSKSEIVTINEWIMKNDESASDGRQNNLNNQIKSNVYFVA